MNSLIVSADLQVIEAFAQKLALQVGSPDEGHGPAYDRSFPPLNSTQIGDELVEIRFADPGRRHAASRQARLDKRHQLLIIAGAQTRQDGRTHLASIAVGAVAARATAIKNFLSGVRRLRKQHRSEDE